ncbi:MAG: stalk domain-containing protein [Clostridia bacterium]|nr:stalk domain-containing protein [Clostridia bacterium]
MDDSLAENEKLSRERNRLIILTSGKPFQSQDKQYSTALASIGIHLEKVNISHAREIDLQDVKLLIVPGEITGELGSDYCKEIIDQTKEGLLLITEQKSLISEGLGIRFQGSSFDVNSIQDKFHTEADIRWPDKLTIEDFDEEGLEVFCRERVTQKPVLAGGTVGKGKFIYIGIPFDKPWAWGFSRFPFFHEAMIEFFKMKPEKSRNKLMTYVDWGYHYADNPIKLANQLGEYGVNEVHLSAWYSFKNCSEFFKKFIDQCHANGILVYCWLELPMVSKEFWDVHPEWREKTANGKDAQIDWRYLMALENPNCMEAVKKEISEIMDGFDWDGIDLAELYFESPGGGFDRSDIFTPMNEYVRKDFKQRYNIDPIELFNTESPYFYKKDKAVFDTFVDYRAELCLKLNKELMEFIKSKRNQYSKSSFDITLTQIDSVIDQRMKTNIGVDSSAFMKLQEEYDFTLQVEDPFTLWSLGPDRYKDIVQSYRPNMSANGRIAVDINIVERWDTIFPTKKQTGLEFLGLLSEASMYSDQVCIYAANTPYPYDFQYAKYALASLAKVHKLYKNEYHTESPYAFLFEIETKGKEIILNGNEWPCVSEDGIIIPSGMNRLEIRERKDDINKVFITGISTNSFNCVRSSEDIQLKYSDKRNVYISLNKKPSQILIAGKEVKLPLYYNNHQFVVCCPQGSNEITFTFSNENQGDRAVVINGKVINFRTYPVERNGRMLYPFREVLEAIGAKVTWNQQFKTVYAETGGYALWMQVDNKMARANGKDVKLDAAAILKDGKVMAPIRFLCESLNYDVKWSEEQNLILINSK